MNDVKDKGIKSKNISHSIYEKKNKAIIKAVEEGRIVSEISSMGDKIGEIAEQTNLLALMQL